MTLATNFSRPAIRDVVFGVLSRRFGISVEKITKGGALGARWLDRDVRLLNDPSPIDAELWGGQRGQSKRRVYRCARTD